MQKCEYIVRTQIAQKRNILKSIFPVADLTIYASFRKIKM